MLDLDNVDNTTILSKLNIHVILDTIHCILMAFIGEDDFREVYREAINIQSNYYQFGIELGLRFRDMGAIKKAFQLDVAQAFTEVLGIWLRHRYDVKKYGPPTWRRLVEAVNSPTGGNNHALAKRIADHHPVKELDTEQHPSAPEKIPANESTHAVAEVVTETKGR